MFYVKEKISDSAEITIELNDENIFTKCPRCGQEFNVGSEILGSVLSDCGFYGTSIYCTECSINRAKDN